VPGLSFSLFLLILKALLTIPVKPSKPLSFLLLLKMQVVLLHSMQGRLRACPLLFGLLGSQQNLLLSLERLFLLLLQTNHSFAAPSLRISR